MADKNVRKDIIKAMNTQGKRRADDQIEDRRHIESWGPLGEIDTRNYSGHPMNLHDRLEGGAVAALDQAGFGYGDKVLAAAKGHPGTPEYDREADRLDIEQNELRDQYPLANIGARALGAIGPLMVGKAAAKRILPWMFDPAHNGFINQWYPARMGLAAIGTGLAETGYTYQKNKPRGGPKYDPRLDSKRNSAKRRK